jgi:truncated hemoglobin YjbI
MMAAPQLAVSSGGLPAAQVLVSPSIAVADPTLFEQLGGEPVLRSIIGRFVDRLFADPMIGFFFRKASRERVKDKEYELAAQHLGAAVEYTGRPIQQVHAVHPIMGGQFARRLEILRQTLVEAGAPESVIRHWIAHTESLRSMVTRDPSGECIGPMRPAPVRLPQASHRAAPAAGAPPEAARDDASAAERADSRRGPA